MTPKEQAALIDDTLTRLGEHFDCVHILASSHDDSGSSMHSRGVGNWYARIGMAREFLKRDEQIDQAERIAEKTRDEDS